MAAATFGGLGPGLLAILLATISNNYFFMEPFGQWGITREQLFRLLLFVGEGVFISVICARLNAARQRAIDNANEARELEKRILEISDAEQRRIGHDLHDGLGQHLTGIALLTRRLEKHLTASASAEAPDATKLSELAKTAVEWTHDLCRTLSPPALESSGLAEALRELASNVENVFNVECTFEQRGTEHRSDLSIGVHLYRIAQEAASNAIRHGQAKHVQILLQTTSDALIVQVIDDGKGIDGTEPSADGMGLRIMRYRAKMIGASIEVRGRPGGGTVVTCNYIRDSAQSGNGNL
jgi:signal transduction histidine kinase